MPRKKYGKVKQTRLTFASPAFPPDSEHESPRTEDRYATLRYTHPSKSTVSDVSSRLGNKKKSLPAKAPSVASSSDIESAPVATPSIKKSSEVITINDDDESEKDIASHHSPSKAACSDEASSSEEDVVNTSMRKKRRAQPIVIENDTESESNMPSRVSKRKRSDSNERPQRNTRGDGTPSRQTRSAAKSLEAKRSASKQEAREAVKRSASHLLSDLGSPETSDADELVTQPRKRRRQTTQRTAASVDVEGEEEEVEEDPIVSSPAKRILRRGVSDVPRTPRRTSDQERLDLKEDLEDLQDSVVRATRTRGHLANSARSQRQKQLDLLRRRRAGERMSDISSEAELESEHELEGSEIEDHESEDETQPPIKSILPYDDSDIESAIASDEDLDRYDDDFVLDDDATELGVPTQDEAMPIEFSRHNYKQPKEYFHDAVEWMVHNKLNPAFPRDDDLYKVAFMKLETEVQGRAGSQLVSSAWSSSFCRALMARPHIEETAFPITDGHPCDACKRSGHPASFDIKLYGKAYSLETLEPLSDDDVSAEEETTERSEPGERDRKGRILPDENIRWFLGRHCKTKATMAHTLVHWRFHLNEWVIGYLEGQGVLTDKMIVKRSHWSQKKLTKYANSVRDQMVENGEVRKLWRDFHIKLKTARETKESRW
ncbi:hypothetical protein ASPZODRAFT_128336 [Penicilliopsis zonata CBS 506.65]|uniref:DUF4211 domain-containing protein n=1 Tax=Penicilliopsis zonata CBS 506.65 TaxID=1073090 RepID=A0A1L9SRR0_9EURO|nr:hypothetical protein ASPZODRAFT_128336 [Penicilliopsis zonata CBS 506.65]OJJ49806.1 hypothetical protein ASPZODRAFT_128336 [Penicilliopsis zonata CBS 506.65]